MENSNGRHGSETFGQLAASQKSTRDNKGEGLGGGLGALAQRLPCDHLLEAEGEPQQVSRYEAAVKGVYETYLRLEEEQEDERTYLE